MSKPRTLAGAIALALVLAVLVPVQAAAEDAPVVAPVEVGALKADAPIVDAPPVADGLIVEYEGDVEPVTDSGDVTGGGNVTVAEVEPGQDIGFDLATVEFTDTVPVAVAEQAAAQLERSPSVKSAEPNYVVGVDSASVAGYVPGDLRLSATQTSAVWGLDRIDQRGSRLDGRYSYDSTGSGVTAYVLDTGLRSSHRQFTGRVGAGYSVVGDGRGTSDCHGHGTHVAGTLGGSTYGVAKGVRIVPVRVLDCRGAGTDASVVAGINWVIKHHTDGAPAVANMSFGGTRSSALDAAVQRLVDDGVTVVVASGNYGDDACKFSPAAAPQAITVNASDKYDDDFPYSNVGSCSDIYAPGVSITSAWPTSTTAKATLTGTSMASPRVAGVAARILGQDRTLTPAQVWEIIDANSTSVNFGYGYLGDPNKLLYAPSTLPGASVVLSGTPQIGQSLTAKASWGSSVTRSYRWYRSGALVGSVTSSSYPLSAADLGKRISVRVTGSQAGYIRATVSSDQSAAVVGIATPPVLDVAVSDRSTCGVVGDGLLQCVGAGSGAAVAIPGLSEVEGVSLSTGADGERGCAILAEGAVRCWTGSAAATPVTLAAGAEQLDVGPVHSCAVLADATAACWGDNAHGQLGDGTTTSSATPVPVTVEGVALADVVSVATGDAHTCAVLGDGTVRCWGEGARGELGDGLLVPSAAPVVVTGIQTAVSVTADGARSCAVLSDATATCWGADVVEPTPLDVTGVGSLALGDGVECVLRDDATVWCRGANGSGQLGTGGTDDSTSFAKVGGIEDARTLSAGSTHACAATAADEVLCWGSNADRQLADGTTAASRTSATRTTAFGIALPAVSVPTVSGSLVVGNTVSASSGSWSDADLDFQWYRAGSPIAGADGATYRTASADVGKRLTVLVAGSRTGYRADVRMSTPTSTIAPLRTFSKVAAPVISGTARVGTVLKSTLTTPAPTATVTYQWKRSGVPIEGATRWAYTLTAADVGSRITLTVAARRPDYATAYRTSPASASVVRGTITSPVPTIGGSRSGESVLSAKTTGWSTAATLSYQWKRDGSWISGARSETYRLTPADVGHRITVTVVGKRSGYSTVSRTSASTGQIAKPAVPAPTSITAVAGSDTIALTWTAPASKAAITDYVITLRPSTSSAWTVVDDGRRAEAAATVTGLRPGATYFFVITPKTAYGAGSPSTNVRVATLG